MKAGFWLRGARGKINGSVLRKGKRATIQAEYKAPKNPQTAMQMAQRIIFATVAGAAKYMKPIVDHSFEGITDKQESLNHFRKINIARLRSFAAQDFANQPNPEDAQCFLTTKRISALIPNKYLMSDGSLDYTGSLGLDKGGTHVIYTLNNSSFEYEGQTFSPLALITFLFGLSNSSQQLTWCQIADIDEYPLYTYAGAEGAGTVIGNTRFNYGRLVLSEAAIQEDAPVEYSTDAALIAKIKSYFDMNKTSEHVLDMILDNLTFEQDNNALNIDFNNSNVDAEAACLIFSELKNGKWERSKSTMVVAPPSTVGGDNFGLYYGIAIDAWFTKDQIAESDAFLSQGGSAPGNFL